MFATQILRMAGLQLTPTLGGMETRDISVRESAERKTVAAVCLSGALLPNRLSFARRDSDSPAQRNATVHNVLGFFFLCCYLSFSLPPQKKKKPEKNQLPISKYFPNSHFGPTNRILE